MINLLSITWSYDSVYDYKNSFLYRSFIKHNLEYNFINIHFNRNLYLSLEEEFKYKFGYQYEYILYKIFLLKSKLKEINSKYIVYADTNDIACLGSISDLKKSCNPDNIIFSSEIHKYPSETSWNTYSEENKNEKNFLNSGLFIGSVETLERLIDQCINNILSLEYKDFGGDQGVYTYYYIHVNKNIILDKNSKFFLNTYLKSPNSFEYSNNRIINKTNKSIPLFIHDNGWNYGSPKFIESFNLI